MVRVIRKSDNKVFREQGKNAADFSDKGTEVHFSEEVARFWFRYSTVPIRLEEVSDASTVE